MKNLVFASAKQLASMIHRKRIGCLELLDLSLRPIEGHNPRINAIVFMDREKARSRTKKADQALAQGKIWEPLHGVPMTIKDT
jgi:amidase